MKEPKAFSWVGDLMAAINSEALVDAFLSSRTIRTEATYELVSETQIEETVRYVIQNGSSRGLPLVALEPRVMELQVNMRAFVDGSNERPILPSQSVAKLAVDALKDQLAGRQEVDIVYASLVGGKDHARDAVSLERLYSSLGRVLANHRETLTTQQAQFLEKYVRILTKKRYVPYVVLERPLGPGEIVIVDFKRARPAPVRRLRGLWSYTTGRFLVNFPLKIGGKHSAHVNVRPPGGTVLRKCEKPKQWPSDAGIARFSRKQWHLYVSPGDKKKILGAKAEDESEYDARIFFEAAPGVRMYIAVAFGLLGFVPWSLVNLGTHLTSTGPQSILSALLIAGSVLTAALAQHHQQRLAFSYLGGHAILFVIMASAWIVAVQAGPSHSLLLLRLGMGVATKEILMMLAHPVGSFISSKE